MVTQCSREVFKRNAEIDRKPVAMRFQRAGKKNRGRVFLATRDCTKGLGVFTRSSGTDTQTEVTELQPLFRSCSPVQSTSPVQQLWRKISTGTLCIAVTQNLVRVPLTKFLTVYSGAYERLMITLHAQFVGRPNHHCWWEWESWSPAVERKDRIINHCNTASYNWPYLQAVAIA